MCDYFYEFYFVFLLLGILHCHVTLVEKTIDLLRGRSKQWQQIGGGSRKSNQPSQNIIEHLCHAAEQITVVWKLASPNRQTDRRAVAWGKMWNKPQTLFRKVTFRFCVTWHSYNWNCGITEGGEWDMRIDWLPINYQIGIANSDTSFF